MQLHLIRHGQTNWNEERRVQGQSESKLTELGKQQALELKERLLVFDFDAIYCSPSLRTRETAARLFPDFENRIEYLDSLREIDLGPWEGQLHDDIAKASPQDHESFWKYPHLFNIPGAETFFQLQRRGLQSIQQIAVNSKGEHIAIVSHGAIIKSILCHYENRELERLWEPPHMHNCAHSILELNPEAQGHIVRYADLAWPKPGDKGGKIRSFSV